MRGETFDILQTTEVDWESATPNTQLNERLATHSLDQGLFQSFLQGVVETPRIESQHDCPIEPTVNSRFIATVLDEDEDEGLSVGQTTELANQLDGKQFLQYETFLVGIEIALELVQENKNPVLNDVEVVNAYIEWMNEQDGLPSVAQCDVLGQSDESTLS